MQGPLAGIRILDFTRFQQGPFATVLLSDLGADVIKVEERVNGDLGRSLGLEPDGWCGYFEAFNRNKRSITIDVRKSEGQEIIQKLIPSIDVVTDNFRPGVMARFGLDLDQLRPLNPLIITANASGFGAKGDFSQLPGFDIIGQAISGYMSNQGGGPGCTPQRGVSGIADQVGGMIFALGIASAIVARDRQGIGQHVDVSLLGSQLVLQGAHLTRFLRSDIQEPTPQRNNPIFTYYQAADGLYLAIGLLGAKWWPLLCEALDRDDLCDDVRFESPAQRQANRGLLLDELDKTFRRFSRSEWLDRLQALGVPAAPVNDYAAVSRDPQVLANDYITTLDHPSLGPIRVIGTPIQMSNSVTGPRTSAPELGQHTEAILLELGYEWSAIELLKDAEVI